VGVTGLGENFLSSIKSKGVTGFRGLELQFWAVCILSSTKIVGYKIYKCQKTITVLGGLWAPVLGGL